ncbi:psbP-like protein 1, chloroplastic isoform X1 [Telopea speciosissima]|uniref:psbP-like protein 1, chloroplastic isoform X1 n=1 Tax=Telopea speciosissima TaxID=54955 RepID=UPI001CC4393E|nr:psbP-like protein 1, chloroplastic isoform X1 [Telopea speciosissima]
MTASLRNSPAIHWTLFPNPNASSQVPQIGLPKPAFFPCSRRGLPFLVKAELTPAASTSTRQDRLGRRQVLSVGPITTWVSLLYSTSSSFAAEAKKGFLTVVDKKDGYSFLYPFGWQEVVIEGQDKVFKDVIEPLESVSVNMVPTIKQDIRDLGSPQEVAQALIKKVLVPPSQKSKLVEATEHDVDGKTYYTFEFVAQASNFTRHALGAISIGNGKFYTITTGANERRWGKMKDKLNTVIDSFKIFNV